MKKVLFILVCCLLFGCSDKTELHLYSWSDYISPEVVAEFEKEHDCRVVIDSFDSNESMYAKLKSGAGGYDIIVPSSYQIQLLADEGIIEKLDHSKLPNIKANFDSRFSTQILDTNLTYSVPYVVTYTGFLVQSDKVTNDMVVSWNILGEKQFNQKLTLLDDIREVIGAGLMVNGYSINSESQTEIDEAVQTVLKWKALARKFDSESYKTEVVAGLTQIGHGYSSDSIQVILGDDGSSMKDTLKFLYPVEGFTIAFDEMCVMSSSTQKDLAHQFINFIYETENAKENMEYVMGPMPQKEALKLLEPELQKMFIPEDDILKRGQVLKSFADKPEVQEMYNRAWDQIRSVK